MGRMSKKDIEELRDFCSYGCDYSGTKEAVGEAVLETLEELGSDTKSADDCIIKDLDGCEMDMEDFIRVFWDKAAERILNVVETQGK